MYGRASGASPDGRSLVEISESGGRADAERVSFHNVASEAPLPYTPDGEVNGAWVGLATAPKTGRLSE